MTVVRHYTMKARDGDSAALLEVLTTLTGALKSIAGYEGAELLQDVDTPDRIVFLEKWESVDAHKAGAAAVPKDIMGAVVGALDGRPDGAYLQVHSI